MKKLIIAIVAFVMVFALSAKAVTLLQVPQGGTGAGTLTGVVVGNGTGAFTTNSTGNLTSDLNLDSNTLVISYDDNKVGLGTTTPAYKLDVVGSIQTDTAFYGDYWISATSNSMNIQPTGDLDDYFSFKTPAHRPTMKVEGGSRIYVESSDVNEVGLEYRKDASHSGAVIYYKTENLFGLTSQDSMVFKVCGDYDDYVKICAASNVPEMSTVGAADFKINAGGANALLLNHAGGNVAVGAASTSYILGLGTGDTFGIGTTQWNSADEIDGTKIKDADYGDVVIDAAGDWQVSEGEVDHDTLLNFVANEHLDWTGDQGATNIHSGNYTDTNTQLSEEQVEDFTGGMLGGTETHIAVTYQDITNDIDFVVSDDWWNADGDISADAISESKIAFSTACGAGNHYYLNGNDLACEADDAGLTNLTDFDQTAWRLFYATALGDVVELSLGADGQYLKSQGGTSTLTWGVPTDTTYLGGTNLTLAGTTFNVDDAFLTNNAADVMTASVDASTILTIQNTDTAIGTAGHLLELIHDSNDDADADFLICQDDGAGTPDTVFSIAHDGTLTVGGSLTSTFNDSLSIGGLTAGTVDMGAGNLADLFVSDDLEVDGMIYGDGGFTGTLTGSSTDVSCAECLIIGTEVKAGTLTDTKYCTWDNANGQIVCDSTPAGSGDVTDVFDCATGDCNTLTVGTSEYLTYGTGYIDANRFLGVTTVDATEFGYLNGVTSLIQTQFAGKEGTLTNSAGLLAALSDETGTGVAVFGTSPTFTTGVNLPAGSIDTATEIANDVITHAQIADSDQTDTKCLYLEDPVADDDLKSIWRNSTANNFLITEIWGESDQTVSFDLQVDDGTPADVSGTDIAPAAGEAEDTTLTGDTTLAASEELDLIITSVSGTPTWVSICWTGNWVD